ncbi:hypothetical protein [Spirosoma sp. KUDC1026]|uniref:hypothetical protein n=1 Tax=Spirosoma sp. KUDC1026 TaxID=2745947 RepID=UPI00159B8675|nr:hypothetical protein [Spirosoma sp. KUDC1026]QKZ14328.1 hypothetical protein HU175_17515 [Spirosoma sp. KUDC1026]
MRIVQWSLFFLVGILGCSTSTPDPTPGSNAYAHLNGQAWSGIINAWQSNANSGSCTVNTVNLSIQNKQPYPKARMLAPAFCAGYCGDQSLSFTHIPLATGTYPLSAHQPCPTTPKQVGVSFTTLSGGDILLDTYKIDSTQQGRLTITRYDSKHREIEGIFDVTLRRVNTRQVTSDAAEVLQFRQGNFWAKLP